MAKVDMTKKIPNYKKVIGNNKKTDHCLQFQLK